MERTWTDEHQATERPHLIAIQELLTETKEDMDELLEILQKFCNKWRLEVNETKTEMMVVRTKATAKKQYEFTYNGETLRVVNDIKYLGVWISSDLKWNTQGKKIVEKAKKRQGEWMKVMYNKNLSVYNRINLYKTMVRPVIEYGAEVWWPTEQQLKELEKVQRECAKTILGVVPQTANVAVIAETGLPSIRSRFEKCKMRYHVKLCNTIKAEPDRILAKMYKEMKGDRWVHYMSLSTWCGQMRNIRERMDESLKEKLNDALEMEPSDREKQIEHLLETDVRQCIGRIENNRMKAELEEMTSLDVMKDHLDVTNNRFGPKMATYFLRPTGNSSWKQQRLMFQLRSGTAPIGVYTERIKTKGERIKRENQQCMMCGKAGPEDQKHFLLECKGKEGNPAEAREKMCKMMADQLKNTFPNLAPDVKKWFEKLDDEKKLRLLLADFRIIKEELNDEVEFPVYEKVMAATVTKAVWIMFQARTEMCTRMRVEKEKKEEEEERKKKEEEERRGRADGRTRRALEQVRVNQPTIATFAEKDADQPNLVQTAPRRRKSSPTLPQAGSPHHPQSQHQFPLCLRLW